MGSRLMITTTLHNTDFIHAEDYTDEVDIVSSTGSMVTVPYSALRDFVTQAQQPKAPTWGDVYGVCLYLPCVRSFSMSGRQILFQGCNAYQVFDTPELALRAIQEQSRAL